jgi:hypothetical protein
METCGRKLVSDVFYDVYTSSGWTVEISDFSGAILEAP